MLAFVSKTMTMGYKHQLCSTEWKIRRTDMNDDDIDSLSCDRHEFCMYGSYFLKPTTNFLTRKICFANAHGYIEWIIGS
jgi:hypothetical protein